MRRRASIRESGQVAFLALGIVLALAAAPDAATALAGRIAEARDEPTRQALAREVRGEEAAALARALVTRIRPLIDDGDPSAEGLLDLALEIARRSGSGGAEAAVVALRAYVHAHRGELREALTLLEEARGLAEAAKDRRETARVDNDLANIRSSQGDLDAALAGYARVLPVFESLGERGPVANVHRNVAIVRAIQGDYDEALDEYRRALTTFEELGDAEGRAGVLAGIGHVQLDRGRFREALDSLSRARAVAEAAGLAWETANGLNSEGAVFSEQGDYDLALDRFRAAMAAMEPVGDKNSQAMYLSNIGEALAKKGNPAGALDAYRRALPLLEAAGDKLSEANLHLNIAGAAAAAGDRRTALEELARSRVLFDRIGSEAGLARYGTYAARVLLDAGDARGALAAAQHALAVARGSGAPQGALLTVAGLSRRALGDRAGARALLFAAIGAVELESRQIAGSEETQSLFFETRRLPFQALLGLLMESSDATRALEIAERARARVLLDVLRHGRAHPRASMTDAERRREREIDRSAATLDARIAFEKDSAPPDEPLLAKLEARRQEITHERTAFVARLYAAHPGLEVLRAENPPLGLDGAARLADDRTLLIEYALARDKAYVFAVARNARGAAQLTAREIGMPPAEVETLSRRYRERVASRDLDYRELGRALYDALLGPLAAELAGHDRVVIVPDGALWELPFQALIAPDGRFLVERASISYAPSLTALAAMRVRGATIGPAGAPSLLAAAYALPGVDEQVRALADLYGSGRAHVLAGTGATPEAFMAAAPRYDVLHVAAHGALNDAAPLSSTLALAPSSSGTGLLEARSLMDLDLHARLAVLSACETGRGRAGSGEGVIGFSWALFLAGCPTAVVGLWRVDATSTARLMRVFHETLLHDAAGPGRALDAARSLRRADLDLLGRTETRHPFYWAGFFVVGAGFSSPGDGASSSLAGLASKRSAAARSRRESAPGP